MNTSYLKYALTVADARSISKAADILFLNQSNLSRSIRELEKDFGIVIFKRTAKGVSVTPEGEEFLQYAKSIVRRVDSIEDIYKNGKKPKQSLSVCVPRASYISYALSEFAKGLKTDMPAEIFYKETNSMRTIDNVLKETFNLGMIRYQETFDKYFDSFFEEKNLVAQTVSKFRYVLLMSKTHSLALRNDISLKELSGYIEISHSDPYVPSLPEINVKKAELSEYVDKRIYVFERASQFVLLSTVPDTFMWVSPPPEEICDKYGLICKNCAENKKTYKDVIIYRRGYKLTELDNRFIGDVNSACTKYMQNFQG